MVIVCLVVDDFEVECKCLYVVVDWLWLLVDEMLWMMFVYDGEQMEVLEVYWMFVNLKGWMCWMEEDIDWGFLVEVVVEKE